MPSLRYIISATVLSLFVFGGASAAVFNVANVTQFQDALTTAGTNSEDDTINVAAGIINVASTLRSETSDTFSLEIQGAGAESTILDGGNSVKIMSLRSGGSISVRGITFRNGDTESTLESGGGGLSVGATGNAVIIEDCTFLDNKSGAVVPDGGLVVSGGTVTINNNTFTGNSGGQGSGGASVHGTTVTITVNRFNGNTGGAIGGLAVDVPVGTAMVADNVFVNNGTLVNGGGIGITSCATCTLVNNIFFNNTAPNDGGDGSGLYAPNFGTLTLTNNTFLEDRFGHSGFTVHLRLFGTATANVYNNIVWDTNGGTSLFVEEANTFDGQFATANVFNNDTNDTQHLSNAFENPASYTSGANINADPLFVDLVSGDVHLMPGSPAINAGENSAPALPAMDFEGNARILGGIVDIGADEASPEPDITVNGTADTSSGITVSFGIVTTGTSSDQTVTVVNGGSQDLIIGNVAQMDALPAPFSIQADNCSGVTLSPVETCVITVRFSPTAEGSFNDSFDIPSNDPDEAAVTVSVMGDGVPPAPDIVVTDPVEPIDDLTVPFGSVTTGTSADKTVNVANAGNANLVIDNVVASADVLVAPFSIPMGSDGCSGATLEPMQSCSITVRFSPTAEGSSNGSFDILSNDPDEALVSVSVSGTGSPAPVPDITVTDSVAPDTDLQIPFPDTTVGTSRDESITVTNDGAADLKIGMIGVFSESSFSIQVENCSATTLAPSQSCSISVSFAPVVEGTISDTLAIPSDDPDEASVGVEVSGTGLSPAANNPPSAPQLVFPANGQVDLPTIVNFQWNASTDPDGDPITYDLFVCDNESFAGTAMGCETPINNEPIATSIAGNVAALAGAGFGFLVVRARGERRKNRRRKWILLALLVPLFAVNCFLASCGGHDHDGNGSASTAPTSDLSFTASSLNPGTAYFWKVVASDGTASTPSETRSFTTQ
jgi:hypothetical protein